MQNDNCRNINLYVTDIMRRDVVFVSYGSSYKELRDKLNKYTYSSFALVDSDGEPTCHYNNVQTHYVLHNIYKQRVSNVI